MKFKKPMKQTQFKKKLDNREFWGDNSEETREASSKWQEQANENNNSVKWSWDCGLKLNYDGDVCRIESLFYPPHKSSDKYGKYHGTIRVMIGFAVEPIHEKKIEAKTLDELQTLAENYVSKILDKMHKAIRAVF